MQKKLNWQAYTNQDRHKILADIKNAITANDAYVVNFNMFSDLALNLSLEIEEHRIHGLHDQLVGICEMSDFDVKIIDHDSKKEWLIFMNISFGKGKGKLKLNIPEVPG